MDGTYQRLLVLPFLSNTLSMHQYITLVDKLFKAGWMINDDAEDENYRFLEDRKQVSITKHKNG